MTEWVILGAFVAYTIYGFYAINRREERSLKRIHTLYPVDYNNDFKGFCVHDKGGK